MAIFLGAWLGLFNKSIKTLENKLKKYADALAAAETDAERAAAQKRIDKLNADLEALCKD